MQEDKINTGSTFPKCWRTQRDEIILLGPVGCWDWISHWPHFCQNWRPRHCKKSIRTNAPCNCMLTDVNSHCVSDCTVGLPYNAATRGCVSWTLLYRTAQKTDVVQCRRGLRLFAPNVTHRLVVVDRHSAHQTRETHHKSNHMVLSWLLTKWINYPQPDLPDRWSNITHVTYSCNAALNSCKVKLTPSKSLSQNRRCLELHRCFIKAATH